MKKTITLSLIIFGLLSANFSYALTYVEGYYRKDGTYVQPYYRQNSNDLPIAEDKPRTIYIIKDNELDKQILEEQKKISEKLQEQADKDAFMEELLQAEKRFDLLIVTG